MRRIIIATSLVLQLAAPLALASDINCRVVAIVDGDTFKCLNASNEQVKVRMAEIDAPESKQPYGTRARQALSEMVFGKEVSLQVRDTDRYGRTVARVFEGQVDVNAELVSKGAAWVYRQYSRDRQLLILESEARVAGRGVWSLPEAERMPPWEWRRTFKKRG